MSEYRYRYYVTPGEVTTRICCHTLSLPKMNSSPSGVKIKKMVPCVTRCALKASVWCISLHHCHPTWRLEGRREAALSKVCITEVTQWHFWPLWVCQQRAFSFPMEPLQLHAIWNWVESATYRWLSCLIYYLIYWCLWSSTFSAHVVRS